MEVTEALRTSILQSPDHLHINHEREWTSPSWRADAPDMCDTMARFPAIALRAERRLYMHMVTKSGNDS